MKLVFNVTGVQKVSDSKLLVQLQGKYGHIALDLPLGHMVSVGTRFVLDDKDAVTSLVAIDETVPVSIGLPRTPPQTMPKT